jgi:hypothetical protein
MLTLPRSLRNPPLSFPRWRTASIGPALTGRLFEHIVAFNNLAETYSRQSLAVTPLWGEAMY